jgi:hypothetical protein
MPNRDLKGSFTNYYQPVNDFIPFPKPNTALNSECLDQRSLTSISLIYFSRGREALRSRVAGRALRRFLIGPWTLPTEHVEIATFTRLPLAHDCSRTLKLGWV